MDSNEVIPEIAFTSNGDGTYTLAIGYKTYSNITFEEVITRINSEVDNGREVLP